MLEQIIIGLLIVTIVLMLYFNLSKGDKQEDFNIQAIKDVQVEIKENIAHSTPPGVLREQHNITPDSLGCSWTSARDRSRA